LVVNSSRVFHLSCSIIAFLESLNQFGEYLAPRHKDAQRISVTVCDLCGFFSTKAIARTVTLNVRVFSTAIF
ncbi:MAG: hypothetical protein NZM11_10020, partial [Anaerolineales bacterium]|nr:hypothetical protein [Anaerolineales bacterium]